MSKGKEQVKKATFQDLIAKKLQKDENKNKTLDIYVSSMDRTLTFTKPSEDMILDFADRIGDGTSTKTVIDAFKEMIYHCCSLLQNPELHTQLEVVDPYDVVSTIFELNDINEIGEQLTEFFGIKDKREEIKN